MCLSVWFACMYVHFSRDLCPYRSKRALDPQELQLWAVVSHHIGAWNKTWVIYKSNKGSQPVLYLFRPQTI